MRRPSKSPPMKIRRFWGGLEAECGVCSKAVRKGFCTVLGKIFI